MAGEIDPDSLKDAMVEHAREQFKEYVETEAQQGHFECEKCGSDSFDFEVWETQAGEVRAGGVCRGCNTRVPVEIDMSDFDDLR